MNCAWQDTCFPQTATARVCVVANGCHENYMDATLLQRYLDEHCEFEVCEDYTEADIIFVFGCSVTQHMENESLDLIEYLKEHRRPESRLFVMGCISKVRPELRTEDREKLIPLDDIESLLRMDDNAKRLAVNTPYNRSTEISDFVASRKRRVFERYIDVSGKGPFQWFTSASFNIPFKALQKYKDFLESRINVNSDRTFCIKISTGCLGDCSYCSVKLSRGTVKSKTIDDVMGEIERGLHKGFQHFALLGTDIGDYGKDLGVDLLDLLEKVVTLKANFRVRLRNVNPRWIISSYHELCKLLRSQKIIYIQSSIQSGNERILELMKRRYRASEFIKASSEIHRRFPFVVLQTQIIVGFPTETEEELEDSVAVVDSGIFDYIDVFRYSRRPSTAAASIGPEVPFDVIMRRYIRLLFRILFKHVARKAKAIHRLNYRKIFKLASDNQSSNLPQSINITALP